jgi:hypothetical protein
MHINAKLFSPNVIKDSLAKVEISKCNCCAWLAAWSNGIMYTFILPRVEKKGIPFYPMKVAPKFTLQP